MTFSGVFGLSQYGSHPYGLVNRQSRLVQSIGFEIIGEAEGLAKAQSFAHISSEISGDSEMETMALGINQANSIIASKTSTALLGQTYFNAEAETVGESKTDLIANLWANGVVDINGTSEAESLTQVYAHVVGQAQGSSEGRFYLTSVARTQTTIQAQTKGEFKPIQVIGVPFFALGRTLVRPERGVGIGVTFTGKGFAETYFSYLQGHEFHARALSSSRIFGWSTATVPFDSYGRTQTEGYGDSLVSADTGIVGTGLSDFFVAQIQQSRAFSRGSSVAWFPVIKVIHRDFEANGYSDFSPHIQIVKNRDFESLAVAIVDPEIERVFKRDTGYTLQGFASTDLHAEKKVFLLSQFQGQGDSLWFAHFERKLFTAGDFTGQGDSLVIPHGQRILPAVVEANGFSHVIWYRGRNTLPHLDPSYLTIIRPEEIRRFEWKE